jgi:threonine dehydrogenase-like Zn-dependent dehydrogenase
MRAVAYEADGTLRVVDRPEPEPGPGDVVIAVERCGICGSDLHLRNDRLLPPGAVMGHEFAGTIAAVGDDANGVAVGDRVAVLPMPGCGACRACREGRTQLCENTMAVSVGLGMLDGGYAEYVRTAASTCFPLPPAMTLEQGALVEPYAVALHGVRRSTRLGDLGDTGVGIIGAGPIGLMTLAVLRAEGVEHIVMAERNEQRAEMAMRLGAEAVASDAASLAAASDAELEVVFECSGITAGPDLALQNVRSGGEIVILGVSDPRHPSPMTGFLWVMKEVDVRPSIAYTRKDFGDAVAAVAGGAVDVAAMVSAIRPLEDANRSFDELGQPGGPVKVLLAPTA